MSISAEPLLRVASIETFYMDRLCVLRGLSMDLPAGHIRTIIGPNGAGKSTLLKTILGLIKDQPRKGSIDLAGRNIARLDPDEITRRGIGYVPEHRGIFPELTVWENLQLGLWKRDSRSKAGVTDDTRTRFHDSRLGRRHHEASADLDFVLSLFPILGARVDQEADKLSGGEQQMLALGRAFLRRPKLLLLDEPSLGLSPKVSREVLAALTQFRDQGITILLIEQNARLALEVADYGYVMEGGRIVLEGTSQELLEHPDVQELYLGIQKEESAKGWRLFKKRRRW